MNDVPTPEVKMNHPVNPPGPQYQQGPGQPQWQGPPPQGPGQPGYGPQGPVATAPRKKSRAKIIVAAVVALAVIAGAGFAAFMLLKKPASVAAADVLPDNPLIVASIDLNPSASDQLAVKDLAEKFPEFTDGLNITEGNYKKALVEFALKNNQDYTWADFEPWLGDSITIATYADDPAADPQLTQFDDKVILAIQHKDASKAEAFAKDLLAKPENSEMSYQIVNDYLLFTGEGEELPDQEAVKKAPLANNADFKADLAKLPAGALVSGWLSTQGFKVATKDYGASSQVTGHLAFGLRVDDGAIVLDGFGWQDQKFEGKGEAVADLVGNLPDDAIAAFGGSASEASIDQAWSQIEQDSVVKPQLEQIGITSKEDLKALLGKQFAIHVPDGLIQTLSGGGQTMPSVGVAVKPTDVAAHEAVINKLGQLLPGGVKTHTEGDKVFTSWNGSPEDLAKPKGRLADDETYKKVVKDQGDANAILFVNVGDIVAGLPAGDSSSSVEPFRKIDGVGLVAKQIDDHSSSFTVRVAFK